MVPPPTHVPLLIGRHLASPSVMCWYVSPGCAASSTGLLAAAAMSCGLGRQPLAGFAATAAAAGIPVGLLHSASDTFVNSLSKLEGSGCAAGPCRAVDGLDVMALLEGSNVAAAAVEIMKRGLTIGRHCLVWMPA